MADQQYKYSALTEQIIGLFYHVYNGLGYGFLERVYENALVHKLREDGLRVTQQAPLTVYFEGVVVGEFFADVIVEDKVVLELKSVERLNDAHTAQLLNYLRATDCEVGLVLNFGPKPKIARRVMDNANKSHLRTVKNPK